MKAIIKSLTWLFAAMMFTCFAACKSDMEKIRLITTQQHFPKEKSVNVELMYTDSGELKAKIFAPLLERHETANPYMELPKGMKAYFYGDNPNKPESMIRANYAIHYEQEKKMVLKNNVVVVNTQGDTLETEELKWEETTGKIYSEKFVKITTPDHQIWGDGFESNQTFSKWKIKKVRGTMSIKNAEKDN